MIEILQKITSEKFTIDVLHDILKKQTGLTDVIIKRIKLGEDVKKGESYMSMVTRFTVEIESENGEGDQLKDVHVITKTFPANIARRKTFRNEDFFKNEIAFYLKIWPTLDLFQKSKGVSNPVKLVPRCLAAFSDGVNDFLALEDLGHEGFSAMSRTEDIDLTQAMKIIRDFGKFHALSVAYRDQFPEQFEELGNELCETYFDEKYRAWYRPVLTKMCWILRDAVEKELPEKYLQILDCLLKEDIYGGAVKACHDREAPLCGIAHGDCWAPNFLVKPGDGGLEMKFIDYQLSRCASVTMDLPFFLYTCVGMSLRNEHWDDFLKEYCNSFASTLKELGSSETLVSVDIVKEGMKRTTLGSFAIIIEGIVMSSLEEEDIADIDDIKEETTVDNVWILKLITNKDKRRNLACFFQHLVDQEFI